MKLNSVLNIGRNLFLASSSFISSAEVTSADEVTNNKPAPIVSSNKLTNKLLHPKLTNEQFDNLIKDLGSEKYADREKASNALKDRLQDCPISNLETFIKRLQKANPDLEVKRRIELSLQSSTFTERLGSINNDNEKLKYISVLVRVGLLSSDTISEDPQRRGVAAIREADPAILTFLAGDRAVVVRMGVAGNLNTPGVILTDLSADQWEYVRDVVARNPNTPIDTLRDLMEDRDSGVRMQARANYFDIRNP